MHNKLNPLNPLNPQQMSWHQNQRILLMLQQTLDTEAKPQNGCLNQ
jgi:hypothetical protein